jgi:hypothetical protein
MDRRTMKYMLMLNEQTQLHARQSICRQCSIVVVGTLPPMLVVYKTSLRTLSLSTSRLQLTVS